MIPPPPLLLSTLDLSLDLGGRRVLDHINLHLRSGETLGLTGPNGGGKSSLLKVLLGIFTPTAGTLRWHCPSPSHSRSTTPSPIRTAYVPQSLSLDPSYPLSAREVLLQGIPGASIWSRPRRDHLEEAESWLVRLDLDAHQHTRFVHLSGGQQRRFLLARALLRNPHVLFLDEPTAGLDALSQDLLSTLLLQLHARGITVVLVSHDLTLLHSHAHRLAHLDQLLRWQNPSEPAPAPFPLNPPHLTRSCGLPFFRPPPPTPFPIPRP